MTPLARRASYTDSHEVILPGSNAVGDRCQAAQQTSTTPVQRTISSVLEKLRSTLSGTLPKASVQTG